MAKYLVTGAAGFIGSHLSVALLEGGDRVVVLDDLVPRLYFCCGCRAWLHTFHASPLEGCHVVNIACGGSHSVLEILDDLRGHADVSVEPEFKPARVGDVLHSRADISAVRRLIGFEPSLNLADGLKQTYDWYRSTYE